MKKIFIIAFLSSVSMCFSLVVLAADTLTTESGIKYVRLKEGDGIHPKPGQSVKVIYSRKSVTGRVVESNEGSKPFKFQVSNREVIPGWDQAVLLMSKGEKWYCIIPSELGYGKKGIEGVVAPNATLYFLIEVVDIK